MSDDNKKIPPQLILYRAPRFSQVRPNNHKYAFFSPKLEYSANIPLRYFSKKHYTNSKVSIRILASSRLETSFLMRFTTKFQGSIRHLSLRLFSDDLPTPDSEIQIQKALMKLLKTCSKIKNLEFQVTALYVKTELSLRIMRLIKSLQNFSCTFWIPSAPHFENLTNCLVKTQRESSKRTNSFHFHIDSSYDAENDSFFDWISFANSFETLNSKLRNSQFSLEMSFNPREKIKDFFECAQRCLSFSSLRELSTNLDLFDLKGSLKLLSLVQESQDLKKLSLKLKDSSMYGDLRPAFPQHIKSLTFKSLAHLHLDLEGIGDSRFLPNFFKTVILCNTQLSSLSVYSRRAADSIIKCLTHSLDKFDKLSSLTLNVNCPPIPCDKLAPIVKAFYEKLSVLKQLNEFNLNFEEQTEAGSVDVFSAFCESLGNLKELKRITLGMNETGFEGGCLTQLANALPNLDSLVLQCNGFSVEQISGNNLSQFITSLTDLKNLSCLELTALCENIDDQCAKEIVASLWQIKSLNSVHFYLYLVHYDPSVDNYLQEEMQKFENKIDIVLSICCI